MEETKYRTLRTYRLLSIIPVQGWKAVCHQSSNGLHSFDIPFLGVAEVTSTDYEIGVGGIGCRTSNEPRISTDIVGVKYHPEEGFDICDAYSNRHCGVMPPGVDIADVCYAVDLDEEYDRDRGKYFQAEEKSQETVSAEVPGVTVTVGSFSEPKDYQREKWLRRFAEGVFKKDENDEPINLAWIEEVEEFLTGLKQEARSRGVLYFDPDEKTCSPHSLEHALKLVNAS